MPSKTPKQAKAMAAAAHDSALASRMGIPQTIAKEFNRADVGSVMPKRAAKPKAARKKAPPKEPYY